jgi:hypothetical protein
MTTQREHRAAKARYYRKTCKRKGCDNRRLSEQKLLKLKPLYREAYLLDGYCSTDCCKLDHGVSLPGGSGGSP